jgi:hypothetical protein
MKRILLVLGLVLGTSLLFAQAGGDPLGDPSGNPALSRWARQVQTKLVVQTQLQEQVRLRAGAGGPLAPDSAESREAPARLQERSGDCDNDCDGSAIQARDQLRDGTGDGTPDRDRTGRPD